MRGNNVNERLLSEMRETALGLLRVGAISEEDFLEMESSAVRPHVPIRNAPFAKPAISHSYAAVHN